MTTKSAKTAKPQVKKAAKQMDAKKPKDAAAVKSGKGISTLTDDQLPPKGRELEILYNSNRGNPLHLVATVNNALIVAEQAGANRRTIKPNGRPRKLPQYDKVKKTIGTYFDNCAKNKLTPTKSGLAYSLGLLSTSSIDIAIKRAKEQALPPAPTAYQIEQYYGDKLIAVEIKRAMMRIEDALQQALLTNGKSVGAIFTLKNHFGYVDAKEIKSDVNYKGISVQISYGVPDKGTKS